MTGHSWAGVPELATIADAGQRLLAVVAHPDDETFGCGSTLIRAVATGAHVTVLCATDGQAGEVTPGVDLSNGVAAVRLGELRAAADILGVHRVETLGLGDSGMSGPAGSGTLCGIDEAELDALLAEQLELHHPDVVFTLDGGDGHRDHRRLSSALQRLVAPPTDLVLQCLPRSLMHQWLRHRAGKAGAAAYAELPDVGTPDDLVTHVVDTADHLAQRWRAIAAHRSQASPFAGLPDDLERAFLGMEYLRRI